MASPRVSIVMLTYNRPQFIGRAIDSIAAQDLSDWELIVVHDGPNQFTRDLVTARAQSDPRIRYFHRDKGGNIANATNHGLRQARGEFIAILDDDDYWGRPDKLSTQVDFLARNPGYAGCGSGMIVIDEQGAEILRNLKPESDEEIKRNALFANPLAHSTSMYRRAAIEQCGLYDESLAGFQDWDVWLKLGRAGKLYNWPEYTTYYQLWEGGGSFHAQRRNTESAIAIVKRHGPYYRGYPVALAMAYSYYAYARLPIGFRRATYYSLSRAKKAFFGGKQAPAA
ncbi:MAG: glycosyltransferase [Bryobacteraceae bacterium]